MIILENEIKKLEEANKQLKTIKECLWLGKNKERNIRA